MIEHGKIRNKRMLADISIVGIHSFNVGSPAEIHIAATIPFELNVSIDGREK